MGVRAYDGWLAWIRGEGAVAANVMTESGFVDFRTQIKKSIESAIQPTLGKTFQS